MQGIGHVYLDDIVVMVTNVALQKRMQGFRVFRKL